MVRGGGGQNNELYVFVVEDCNHCDGCFWEGSVDDVAQGEGGGGRWDGDTISGGEKAPDAPGGWDKCVCGGGWVGDLSACNCGPGLLGRDCWWWWWWRVFGDPWGAHWRGWVWCGVCWTLWWWVGRAECCRHLEDLEKTLLLKFRHLEDNGGHLPQQRWVIVASRGWRWSLRGPFETLEEEKQEVVHDHPELRLGRVFFPNLVQFGVVHGLNGPQMGTEVATGSWKWNERIGAVLGPEGVASFSQPCVMQWPSPGG